MNLYQLGVNAIMQNQELSLKTSQGNATKRTTERSNPSAVEYIKAFSDVISSVGTAMTGYGNMKNPNKAKKDKNNKGNNNLSGNGNNTNIDR